MAADCIVKFLINRTTGTYQLQVTDASSGFTFAKANVRVEYPDGYSVDNTDFDNPDISAAAGSVNKDVRFDVNNKVLLGDYKVIFTALDDSDVSYVAQKSFNFTWSEPVPKISNASNVIEPEVKFKDATSGYDNGNFTEVINSRTLTCALPSTSEANPASNNNSKTDNFGDLELDMQSGSGYYEGVYSPSLSMDITYSHTNGYLSLQYIKTHSENHDVRKVPTQAELTTLIKDYKIGVDSYKTSNPSVFARLSEEYDLVIALYNDVVNRKKLAITSGSEDILRELLAIVQGNVTNYTYQSTIITSFSLSQGDGGDFNIIIQGDTGTDTVNGGETVRVVGAGGVSTAVTDNEIVISTDGAEKVTEDITSNGVGTVGGVASGDVIATGTTLTQFLKKLLQKSVAATYSQSTASISDNVASTVEVGQSFTPTLSISYTQRDSGAASTARFYRAGVLINTDNSAPFSHVAATEDLSSETSLSYSGQVDHAQGAQKYDNFGDPSGNPATAVPARTGLSAGSVTISAKRKIFGGKNNAAPTTSALVRALASSQYTNDNTLSISVSAGDTSVEIAIPSYKNLVTAQFVGALTSIQTQTFLNTETTVSVEGAEGKYPTNYKVYRYVPTVPFASSAVYNFTFS